MTFVDLPGTYSLNGNSEDEKIAGEYISGGNADCTVVVCDGSCLERSLILALQILQITDKVLICVNLMDEAKRMGISVNASMLQEQLGVPVMLTSVFDKRGKDRLLQEILDCVDAEAQDRPYHKNPIMDAQRIAILATAQQVEKGNHLRNKIDRLLVSRQFGIPIMLLILLFVLWVTIWGANYPSAFLERVFDSAYGLLYGWLEALPNWLKGILLDGIYMTTTRVISVMLPPMMIFFPLFTILEDIGYLPRLAFLLDGGMRKCGGCGKQALTLCMGLGCNAVGVTGCRIMESPRERLVSILTNAMVPCNGRFPTLVILAGLLCSGFGGALIVAGCVVLGVFGAMVSSGVLSKTVCKHKETLFLMELPPFRRPRIGQILVRSLVDRTLHISLRAVKVAAPAGALLWILANTSALSALIDFLEPIGLFLGMRGVILLGFLFSLPANELFIPVVIMGLSGVGTLQGVESLNVSAILAGAFTWETAVCTMVFTLFHWPCATTLMTVYRETGSKKQTTAAFLLPTVVGCMICIILNLIFRLI